MPVSGIDGLRHIAGAGPPQARNAQPQIPADRAPRFVARPTSTFGNPRQAPAAPRFLQQRRSTATPGTENNEQISFSDDESVTPGRAEQNAQVAAKADAAGLAKSTKPNELKLSPGDKHIIRIDRHGLVQLAVEFAHDTQNQYFVSVNPVYEKSNNRMVNGDIDDLKDDISKLHVSLSKWVAEYITGSANSLQLRSSIVATRKEYNRLSSSNNPGSFARLNVLGQRISTWESQLKNISSLLKKHEKGIPNGYDSLGRMIAIYRALGTLQNSGEFGFHFKGEGTVSDVIVRSADGKPSVVRKEVVVPPFNLVGNWIRFDIGLIYSLAGDNSGGSIVVSNAFNPDAPKQNGNWNRTGDTIKIRMNNGVNEQYSLHEDVLMRSATASLFRQLN